MATTPTTENLVELLRVGIARIESGGSKNPYSTPAGDKNKDGKPDSTAMGKYQFLKSYWWDTKHPINGIKQFAKGKEDVYGKIDTWDQWKGNAALQEAYFSYYAKNHLIPEAAKAIAKGNPLNLTLDQAAAVIHKEGFGGGAKVINSGKLTGETSTNASDAKYIKDFSEAISKAGYDPVKVDDYVSAKVAAGEKITPEEKKILKTREERKADYAKRDRAIDKMEEDGVGVGTRENLRRDLLKEISRNGDQGLYDEYVKESNEAVKSNENKSNKDQIADDVAAWNSRDKKKGPRNPRLDTVKVAESTGVNNPKKHKEENKQSAPQRPPIDWAGIDTEVAQEAAASDKEVTGTGEGMDVGLTTPEEKKKAESSDEENADSAGQAFERQQGILDAIGKGNMEYEKSNYTKELPVDAVTGLALGLIGNEQAKNANVPLRTEDVGQAVKAYTSELALRAKDGLPPEVEAAIQNKLAEAYSGGLENIRNASGGNRATILGNQGTLEVAKNKGLVDMQLADYEAKERAFQQYGEAIQYIDRVRMTRDVANTQMKQQRGLMQEQKGEQLAGAGFAKMIEGLKYQKENGPGSANHMYKSALMQKMFGFDPMMKDDGTGKPGTRSEFLKKKQERELESNQISANKEKYYNLDPETRKLVDTEYLKNPTMNNLNGLVAKYSPEQQAWNAQTGQVAEAPVESGFLPKELFAEAPEEQKPLSGIQTAMGFLPNTLLGTEPNAVAPRINIPNLATAPLNTENPSNGMVGRFGAGVPQTQDPQKPVFEMPTLDSAIANSMNNQDYNNQ